MGTRLNENASYDSVLSPNPLEPVRAGAGETIGSAAYTIQGINVNGDLNYTPQVIGVRIKHLGGISMALGVTVAGSDITVQLATDGSGNVTSTANAVKTAYDAVAAAVALAVVQVGGTGAGLACVFSSFMPLTDDAFGSVRPALQALTNRDKSSSTYKSNSESRHEDDLDLLCAIRKDRDHAFVQPYHQYQRQYKEGVECPLRTY